ncbi:glycosyltransferase [Paenibacillus xanthanilyticus]|uniref:Glycosyltransferase n=1 Tax=Paenibacillus xanthanilyticus TaxID=1783531 RepID=A0ABV8K341_9BACL
MYYYICVFDMDQRHKKIARTLNNLYQRDFTLITNNKNKVSSDINVEYIPFTYTPGRNYFSKVIDLLRASRAIKFAHSSEGSTNIVICDSLLSMFFYKVASFMRRTNNKVVYCVPDIPNDSFDNRPGIKNRLLFNLINLLEKFSVKGIKHCIFTSEGYVQYYNKVIKGDYSYFILENKPSSYDVDFTHVKTEPCAENTLNEISSPLRIGYFGIIRYKEILLNLIEVSQKFNVEIIIAGICGFSEELKKYSNVHLFGEYDYNQIGSLYSKVDLCLAMYDRKMLNVRLALPNKLYESMVYDTPILVSKGTYLGEIVDEKRIGYSVDPYDKDELEQLLSYLTSTEGRKELRTRSKHIHNSSNELYFETQINDLETYLNQVSDKG